MIQKAENGSYNVKKWVFLVSIPLTVALVLGLWGVGFNKVVGAEKKAEAAGQCAMEAKSAAVSNAEDIADLKEDIKEVDKKIDRQTQDINDVNIKLERLGGNLETLMRSQGVPPLTSGGHN